MIERRWSQAAYLALKVLSTSPSTLDEDMKEKLKEIVEIVPLGILEGMDEEVAELAMRVAEFEARWS